MNLPERLQAIPDTPHRRITWAADWAELDENTHVIDWTCPTCEQRAAESLVQPTRGQARTRIVGVPWPVRWPVSAERDGVPLYAPSKRELRHKDARRNLGALATRSLGRAMRGDPVDGAWQGDYSSISILRFDAPCRNCSSILRYVVPAD